MVYSIIQKSQLEGGHRLDGEYYQPEYLENERRLDSIKTTTIGEISDSVVNFGAYSLCNYIVWQESGVPYLNVENIKEGYIDFEGVKFISNEVNEILKKSKVKEGQIILTMAGTIGNAAVAYKIPPKINSNQATAKITLEKDFSPFYLAAFLNCNYGKKQTEREIVSSVQPNIFLWQIKNFKIPILLENKQKEIENTYKRGLDELEKSLVLYSQAEELLLTELGLNDFKIKEELSYSVNLSKVKSAHRADAEYFQPKYEELLEKINNQKVGLLGDLVTMRKGFEPGSDAYQDEGALFIRVSTLSKHGLIDKDQKYLSEELYKELRNNFEPKIGEILLSKDATPGIAYVLKESIEGILASGIMRLKVKEDIEAEYIALCVNSIVGQIQIERDSGGSIISHWKPEQIKKLQIPILSKSIQAKIADLVRQSHEARKKAKKLLEEAKRKVEKMIEGGDT